MATNKPVFYRAVSTIIDRAAEIGTDTGQFINGANRGVASGAIGINTGDYNPKPEDFSRDEPRYAEPASYIGHLDEAVANNEDQMWGLPDTDDQAATQAGVIGFDYATADTAADADYGSSLVLTNYTGKTIPADGWAWGFEAAGGDPTPPIVEAGGPYAIENNEGYEADVAGTVTAGTDPSPTHLWTIVSGATGFFTDPTALSTRLNLQVWVPGDIVTIALTATPNDGPPVVDTATTFIIG